MAAMRTAAVAAIITQVSPLPVMAMASGFTDPVGPDPEGHTERLAPARRWHSSRARGPGRRHKLLP